jgi:biotin-independent malonate decarboxylase gamma subunit
VIYADAELGSVPFRALAIVPNPQARFPRARAGDFGIEEGWALADCIRSVTNSGSKQNPTALLAVIDVPGQAFGREEEALGLHRSLAAAVDAYATARSLGNPVVALVVGKAISGAFLAHGLQAGKIFGLESSDIEVHVMSRSSVARVTRRSVEEVIRMESQVRATARDVHSFAALGGFDKLLPCDSAESPSPADVSRVRSEVLAAFQELLAKPTEPRNRLDHPAAAESRKLSRFVREQLEAQWD